MDLLPRYAKSFCRIFILVTDCFRKFEQKRRPALVFLANNDPLWCHFSRIWHLNSIFFTLSVILPMEMYFFPLLKRYGWFWLFVICLTKKFGRFPSKILPCIRIFLKNWHSAPEFLGKNYTQEMAHAWIPQHSKYSPPPPSRPSVSVPNPKYSILTCHWFQSYLWLTHTER